MSRYIENNVTRPLQGLAVLVPDRHGDRWAVYFPDESRERHLIVREITLEEIEGTGQLEKFVGPKDLPLIVGVAEMRRAIRKRDETGFRRAYEKVTPWFLNLRGVKTTINPQKIDWHGARYIYSELINRQTCRARLVMWLPEDNLPMPAVMCPDLRTAKFVLLTMSGFKVCPFCLSLYRGKTEYCKPACGINWRTAESRRKKKK